MPKVQELYKCGRLKLQLIATKLQRQKEARRSLCETSWLGVLVAEITLS